MIGLEQREDMGATATRTNLHTPPSWPCRANSLLHRKRPVRRGLALSPDSPPKLRRQERLWSGALAS